MSDMIAWIAAEAERPEPKPNTGFPWRRRKDERTEEVPVQELPSHQFGASSSPPVAESTKNVEPSAEETQKVAQMVDACDEILEAYERERPCRTRSSGYGAVAALYREDGTRLTPYALDQLSEILLKVGLLERVETNAEIVVKGV